MCCPQCGARTVVTETRGPFRDRRCSNAGCGLDFTTREQIMMQPEKLRQCARTRAAQMAPPRRLAAAADMGSNPLPGVNAPSEPGEAADGDKHDPPDLQAEVAG